MPPSRRLGGSIGVRSRLTGSSIGQRPLSSSGRLRRVTDDWVAPGTASGPAASPGATVGGAPAPVSTGAGSGGSIRLPGRPAAGPVPPVVPVPLRPFTVGDLLDGGLSVLTLAPRTVLALVAVLLLPVQVLGAYVSRDAVANFDGGGLGGIFAADPVEDDPLAFFDGGTIVALALESIALTLVVLGVAGLVAGWYAGRSPALGELARLVARSAPVAVAAWVLVHAVEAAFAVLALVPIIVPMTWFAVVAPVVALERVGPLAALKRSYRLTSGRFGQVLGTCLLVAVTDVVLRTALTSIAAVVADQSWGWVADAVLSSVAALVVLPFVAGVSALLYIDLRARGEGLDLQLDARQVLPGG